MVTLFQGIELVTSFVVIFASNWGLPVSTTHVSCGALFGIGVANGRRAGMSLEPFYLPRYSLCRRPRYCRQLVTLYWGTFEL